MKKVIVTTTINPPTKAIRLFDAMPDWQLVVAGDKKTPADYSLKNGIYITPEMQEKYDKTLSDLIGWNCIQRRNFAFLWAKDLGADIIATIDDDNIPYDFWGRDLFVSQSKTVQYYETDLAAFDAIGATNYPHLWHRGFPLQLIPKRDYSKKSERVITADIQADFWNMDPDVDAVCRMIFAPECTFDTTCFPMSANKIAPFNSQNTFISKKVLPHYFMFPHVGRMDDIWPGFYVQARGFKVVFNAPTVYQDRNQHNLIRDMKGEYLGYENNLQLIQDLYDNPEAIKKYMPERTIAAFEQYQRHF